MLDMLKILDDFESVLKNEKNGAIEALFRSLTSLLSSYGLERMNVVGENYSPDLAEVVYTEKSELAQGKITEEVQAGYRLNGKIIRYPKVKIAV
jgi:Molecular chaperone GrpE (heat shock protein)